MATGTLSEQSRRNGSGTADEAKTRPTEEAEGGSIIAPLARAAGGLLGSAAGALTGAISGRLNADLDDRDPDYIRENLPFVWLLSSLYFRAEVRNLGNVPEDKPVLLVGNHSGGNVAPETFIFTLAFATYFGVERPYYQLAHNLVIASPYGQILRKYGTVSASHENAKMALESGAALLVFPGGDWEVHRPSWERNQVDFNGRKGFIRLALDAGVPIVPVVTVGGQETALFLSRGAGLAKLLGIDRMLRLKVLPISIAAPWGLNIGDLMGHLPLPAKITSEVLEPIDLKEQFGPDPDVDEIYEHVTTKMQETLDALAAERRFPVIG
jgi:1-acyl-sn-glycerol-3-phosphate acyltransferase